MAGRMLKIGCRGTEFCRRQTAAVLDRFMLAQPELTIEIVELPEGGVLDGLAAGMCDLHVRGAREVPLELPDDVLLTACTERRDPFDVLVSRDGTLLEDLPEGAVVGLESARVSVQIAAFREDLEFRRLDETLDRFYDVLNRGEIAAFIVAAEDVSTMGWEESVAEVFPPDILLPAAGQGAFGLLTRAGDAETAALVEDVGQLITRQVVAAERAFLRELAVRVTDPVAVHGAFEEDTLVLEAMLGDEISGAILRDDLDGEPEEGADLGIRLAKLFVADGARDYIAGYK